MVHIFLWLMGPNSPIAHLFSEVMPEMDLYQNRIKFVSTSEVRHVGGFHRTRRIFPPNKMTITK
jgi:hypothetical protein